MVRNQQATELSRFLHYYTRFRNHENSQKLEEPLLRSAPAKMALLAAGLVPHRSPGDGMYGSSDFFSMFSSCY